MTLSLIDRVSALVDQVGAEQVLPRYQALAEGEIEEKSPGELVTIADREAEDALARGLAAILPEARFVGEEVCARDPSLLERLGEGRVWIVDPIDGTANFAAGRPPFAIMVALLDQGEIVASWMHDPLSGRIAAAERGSGAWIDGERIRASAGFPAREQLHGTISRFFVPDGLHPAVDALEAGVGRIVPTRRCAGDEYPLVATGERDFALFWRTLVWDHAPGVLFLTESGGVARRPGGAPYRPAEPGLGMVLARSAEIGEMVDALLREGGAQF
jgi:fructose-1,6-bisphosphatase/inositol monophosphatase family enzyme